DAAAYKFTADDVFVSQPGSVTVSNDTFTIRKGGTLIVPAPGLLANDVSEMGGMTAALAVGTTNGTLTLNTDGGFTYQPVATYTGPDTFTYRARDAYS